MVLVISDYHGREEKVISLIEKYKPDVVLNAGDSQSEHYFLSKYNIISVKGNCDYIDLPNLIELKIKDIKVLMTHGHLYGVRMSLTRLFFLAKEKGVDLVIYGHTHVQHLDTQEGITFLNPGSLIEDNYALITDNGEIKLF